MDCKLKDEPKQPHPSEPTTKIRRDRFVEMLTDEGGFEQMSKQLDRLAPLILEFLNRTRTKAEAAGLVAALAQLTASTAYTLIGTDEDPGMRHYSEVGGIVAAFFDAVAAVHFACVDDMKRSHEPVDRASEVRYREAPPSDGKRIDCDGCPHRAKCPMNELRDHIMKVAAAESKTAKANPLKPNDVAMRAQFSVDELIRAINSKGGVA
jgi:hypothetical protein